VILLDPGFNTGMPLLKVLQPDTLREDGLIYYTEMDRQEYLTSMGVNIVKHVEITPTRYIDYGRPLDDIHDLIKSHLADMFRFVETLPLSFFGWLIRLSSHWTTDTRSITCAMDPGSWRFTDLVKIIGITSSAHIFGNQTLSEESRSNSLHFNGYLWQVR
jgi:hypothetical protein